MSLSTTPRARSATNTGWFKHEVVNAVHLCLRLPLRIPMSGHCRPPSGRSGESALACCGMIDVCMWAAPISSAPNETARGVARWGKRARRSACVVSRRDWPTAAHGSAQLTRMASTGGVLWVALGGMVHHVVVQKRMVAVAGVRGLHMQMPATRFVPRCMWDREHRAYCSGGLGVVGR